MQINETTYNAMPAHLRALFVKLPNPGKDEVLAGFSSQRCAPRQSCACRWRFWGWRQRRRSLFAVYELRRTHRIR